MPAWRGWALAATQTLVFVKEQKPPSQLWRPNQALTVQALTARAWPGGRRGSANRACPCLQPPRKPGRGVRSGRAPREKGKVCQARSPAEPRWTRSLRLDAVNLFVQLLQEMSPASSF